MKTLTLLTMFVVTVSLGWADPPNEIKQLQVESVLVTLIEQVEVPARETGILQKVNAREGQLVKEGSILAQIEDKNSRLLQKKAQIEYDIALKNSTNDVKVRAAKKAKEVAVAELKRANESIEKYRKSISATELDRLRLTSERAGLEIEQAEEDLKTAHLNRDAKANDLDIATDDVDRRKIISPISGVVVQINHRRGEWVQPGQPVLRILRINRLRAEGFLNASNVTESMMGRPVVLTVDLPDRPKSKFPGSLVFISPEINAVNGQVRVWAEIENKEMLLRPGLKASMSINLEEAKAALNETNPEQN